MSAGFGREGPYVRAAEYVLPGDGVSAGWQVERRAPPSQSQVQPASAPAVAVQAQQPPPPQAQPPAPAPGPVPPPQQPQPQPQQQQQPPQQQQQQQQQQQPPSGQTQQQPVAVGAPPTGHTSGQSQPSQQSATLPPPAQGPAAPLELLREGPQRHRISLLQQQDYMGGMARGRFSQGEPYREPIGSTIVSGSTTAVQLDPGGQPFKKIRLGEVKPEVQQPLRVDTRPGAYTPQVEAISPTLPSDSMQEDAAFRSTKDDLLQQIGKVDREIAKAESQIAKLKKKQQELEEAASKPAIKKEEEETAQPKHQSPAQKIYAENRKKAQAAHAMLEKLGPKVELPLYNQPSDTAVYHENKRRYLTFKSRLMEYFKRKHAERESREKYLTATYSRLMQEWLRKVDKMEALNRRKFRETRNREFFEKVFPELRKQREDRERFSRVGARVKSEADLEEIMDGLQEQEMEDKKMRSYAVVPPILLDPRQRRITYVNNNGRIEDFAGEYKDRQLINVWTPAEKEVFKEKYLQHPKNFGVIGSYLDRKSVCDCVQYYYLSKKTENYKQLLRKSRQRTRSSRNNPHGKPAGASQNNLSEILSSGVTTRLQREQQQKQEQPNSNSGSSGTSTGTSSLTTTVSSSNVNSSVVTSSASSTTVVSSGTSSTTVTASSSNSSDINQVAGSTATTTVTTATNTTTPSTSSTSFVMVTSSVLSVPSPAPSTLTLSSSLTSATTCVVASSAVSSGVLTSGSSTITTATGTSITSTTSSSVTNNVGNKEVSFVNDTDGTDNKENNKLPSELKLESKKKERRKEDKKKKEEVETSDEEMADAQAPARSPKTSLITMACHLWLLLPAVMR